MLRLFAERKRADSDKKRGRFGQDRDADMYANALCSARSSGRQVLGSQRRGNEHKLYDSGHRNFSNVAATLTALAVITRCLRESETRRAAPSAREVGINYVAQSCLTIGEGVHDANRRCDQHALSASTYLVQRKSIECDCQPRMR